MISLHFFINPSINIHCSINPCFWKGWMLYVKLILLSSCIALSFHTTRKNYSTLIHPFGRGLILYFYTHIYIYTYIYFKNPFYHPSRLSPIPNFRKCHSNIHSFLEGMISLHFLINPSINIQCSINPCFWKGWMLYVKLILLSSCIALSFHTTGKNYSTLIHPFGRGLILYFYTHIYIHTFISRILSIILHASLIPNFRKCHSTIHSFLEGMISLYI